MKKRTKVVCFAVAGVLCFTLLTGCGDKNAEATPSPEPIQTTESTPMPVETPTPPPIATPTPTPTAEPTEAAAEPSASASAGSGAMKLKDENDEVTKVQERLKELGYLDTVTGYFGTDTESAVKKFQERNDLDVDGVVGSGTKKALFADDAKKA